MYKIKLAITILLLITASLFLFTSCDAISDTLNSSSNPTNEEPASVDYKAMAAKISELESKLEKLEQGQDTPVEEPDEFTEMERERHNVQTAVMAMMADYPAYTINASNIPAGSDGHEVVFCETASIKLSSYIKGTCSYSWDVSSDGTVTAN